MARAPVSWSAALVLVGCAGARAPAAPTAVPGPAATASSASSEAATVTTQTSIAVSSGPTRPAPLVVVGRVRVVGPEAAEAIARLERFVADHPEDPDHTPDALLRLGSVYLDQAELALDQGRPDDAPVLAARAAARLREARDRFATYPRQDAVLYQLGHALELADDRAGARHAYQALGLLAASSLSAEGWFRLGELAFDDGDLPAAIAAYQRVGSAPHLGAVAAYKLAWTEWRRGDMVAAAAGFQGVLDRAAGDRDAALLAPEARQYLALALIEDDQDGDGTPDPAPAGATSAAQARVLAYLGDGADAGRRGVAETAAAALIDDGHYRDAEALCAHLLGLGLTADERTRLESLRRRARSGPP